MKRKTSQPPCTSVRFSPGNLAWLKKKAAQDNRKLSPFVDLLITQLREKEAKP